MTIHTVVLCAGRRQGVAFGLDELARPCRVFLMTPRAVDIAMEHLESVGHTLKAHATARPLKRERVRGLEPRVSKVREWSLR